MRTDLLLVMLAVLAGCNAPASKPQAQPKRPAATTKPHAPASLPIPAKPEPSAPVWRVVSVHDGDTLRAVDASKTEHKVRLVGIDAPEIGQAFGTKSRDGLTAMVKGKSVAVHADSEDRYGRTLARLVVEGRDVNHQMVADGLAWHFTRYSDDERLAAAEREARADRRGLWSDPAPTAPWDWRAGEAERKRRPAGVSK
jgi:endonuclease YncB( thermonuclease family)